MKYLFWKFKLWLYINQHCEFTKDWQSWCDWREMFEDGLSAAEAFTECHREI
jgi:hypothetical protein